MLKIAIIGGGYTGLAAASKLRAQGHSVTVFEKSEELGGLGCCRPFGKTWLETFYHHAFQADSDFIALVAELGLSSELEWLEGEMGYFIGGKVYPFGTPSSLLNFSPLSIGDRLRYGYSILKSMQQENWESLDDTSVKAWFRRHVGGNVYDVCWAPLLRAKFGEDGDDISMAWLWGKIRLRGGNRRGSRERLGYVRGNFRVLDRRWREQLVNQGITGELGASIQEVRPRENGSVVVRTGDSEQDFDRVVMTVPMPLAVGLLPDLPADFSPRADSIAYTGVLCGTLILRRPFSRYYWMNIADPQVPFGGLIEHTNLVKDADYGEPAILYVSHYASKSSDAWQFSDEDLLNHWLGGLQRVKPAFSRTDIADFSIARASHAQPITPVGYRHKRLPMRTPLRGVYLTNMTHIFPQDRGLNYAIRSGYQVAQLLTEDVLQGR